MGQSLPALLKRLAALLHEVVCKLIEAVRHQIPRISIFGNQQHGFAKVLYINFVAIDVKSLGQLHRLTETSGDSTPY